MWICESFKSPGQDDIHMGFIKDFWLELKDDILSFTMDHNIFLRLGGRRRSFGVAASVVGLGRI